MAKFDQMLVDVIGDVMVSSGCVAYLGPFTVSTRLTNYSKNSYYVHVYALATGRVS